MTAHSSLVFTGISSTLIFHNAFIEEYLVIFPSLFMYLAELSLSHSYNFLILLL